MLWLTAVAAAQHAHPGKSPGSKLLFLAVSAVGPLESLQQAQGDEVES